MLIYAKNTDSQAQVWAGMTVQPNSYYQLQINENFKWINEDKVIQDIGNGILVIAKDDSGNNDLNSSDGMKYLMGILYEVDVDGRQIQRSAATQKGWRYLAHPIEIETSKLDGVFSEDWQGNIRTDYIIKFYDINNNELTTQSQIDTDCVKTILTIKPDYDYDIIGGNLHQISQPTSDIRLWVIAGAIELGASGVKEFVGGLNFRYMGADEQIKTDGRASARLNKITTGVPYNTNQMQYIFKHDAGIKHKIMIVVEYFRQ